MVYDKLLKPRHSFRITLCVCVCVWLCVHTYMHIYIFLGVPVTDILTFRCCFLTSGPSDILIYRCIIIKFGALQMFWLRYVPRYFNSSMLVIIDLLGRILPRYYDVTMSVWPVSDTFYSTRYNLHSMSYMVLAIY